MSTQYNGLAANIVAPAAVNIASSTNTTPIQITTSSPHDLTTGDTVDVSGHHTNTNANGQWVVSVLSTTQFTLVGSTLNGNTGGATGQVQSLASGPTYATPNDGDARNAASVDVALDALGDRTAMLAVATGAYKLAQYLNFQADNGFSLTEYAQCNVVSLSTYTQFTTLPGPMPWTIDGLVNGDIVEFEWSGTWGTAGSPTLVYLALGVSSFEPGGSGTWMKIQASGQFWQGPGGVQVYHPVTLTGYTSFGGVPGYDMSVQLMAATTGAIADISLFGDYNLTARVWRPTGRPQ
jgi:hypothetical protein